MENQSIGSISANTLFVLPLAFNACSSSLDSLDTVFAGSFQCFLFGFVRHFLGIKIYLHIKIKKSNESCDTNAYKQCTTRTQLHRHHRTATIIMKYDTTVI